MRIFGKQRDFEAFEEVIAQAKARLPMRVLAWCVMPNHWHFVLWPRRRRRPVGVHALADGDAHAALARGASHGGHRPAVPGAFQVVPDPGGRASAGRCCGTWSATRCGPNLVEEAEAWRWSSLWHRVHGDDGGTGGRRARWRLPRRWRQHVQSPQTEAELEALRRSVVRGCPFGEASWQERTAKRLGLQSTLRPRGRPWPKPSQSKDSRPLYPFLSGERKPSCTGNQVSEPRDSVCSKTF